MSDNSNNMPGRRYPVNIEECYCPNIKHCHRAGYCLAANKMADGTEPPLVGRPKFTSRLTFDEAMMLQAVITSARGSCMDRAVGCILTKGKYVVASGYNGAPAGLPHCQDVGCLEDSHGRCIRCVHAETNACLQTNGQMPDTAYCTLYPCISCMRTLLQAGVTRILFWQPRDDNEVLRFLADNYGHDELLWPLQQFAGRIEGILRATDDNIREYLAHVQ